MGWTWKDATPKERGDHVRATAPHCLRNEPKMCELFNLTPHGLRQIMDGADWKPEYQDEPEA